MDDAPARTPKPPYYAVVFTSVLDDQESKGYGALAQEMSARAATMPGYLGLESARSENGLGITVSYWQDEESIRNWRNDAEHLAAQKLGREQFYKEFELRIAKVERAYGFSRSGREKV